MSQDIRDFVTPSCELVALGEPTHQEPAFGWIRNDLFAQLADLGFRSIALEIDRAAALTVNAFVDDGVGTLDEVMRDGFSHGWGELDANRELVAWIRDHNEGRPPHERVRFHGFDAATENYSAPSPRRYLEHARDYLKLDLDIASLAGDDERWSRTEAIMDPAMSVGGTAEAKQLRSIADDLLMALYVRAPEMIAVTSRTEWERAKVHVLTGLGLLRYHQQAAARIEPGERLAGLTASRDALMAQHLLDIRATERRRGGTFVFSHNLHLKGSAGSMAMGGETVSWFGAGAIIRSLGEEYTFVAGSLGSSPVIGLEDPPDDTYEGFLQRRIPTWGLTPAASVAAARTRTDTTPRQGYFPLDQSIVDDADVVLHVSVGVPVHEDA